MRPVNLIACAALAALLAAGPVAAQTSGWVDPPAKSAEPETVKSGEPSKIEAKSADKPARDAAIGEPRIGPRATGVAEARQYRRARSAERRRERGMAMPATNAPRPAEIANETRGSGRAGTAQRLAVDYLDAVSSNAAMLASASRFYGERVRFHGRSMTRSALAAEKSRFVRRWPERRYEPRGGMRTACDAVGATCIVTTAFDFEARNPARALRSMGVGELTLTVDVSGERPQIVSETSRVLRRGAGALSAADPPGHGA